MAQQLPKTFKKLSLKKQTTNFREAVEIVEVTLAPPGDNQVLVKNKYVGVNASDVNITAGRFYSATPMGLGFEAVGVVVQVGAKVTSVTVGQNCVYMSANAYAEYTLVPVEGLFVIPESKPEFITLIASGLTAAIGLDKSAKITEGETVLITAAAGGCGHLAVQWAKAAGCHVIATCSSDAKTKLLKDLGCDRIINYKTEDLGQILEKEYPKGIDVIWETIGGKVFETCLKHLAIKGRLIIVGYITGYKTDEGMPKVDLSSLPQKLLYHSSSVHGFLVLHYAECFHTYFNYLKERMLNDELRIIVDDGKESRGKEFVSFEGILDAVDHLHSGKSIGKVIARFA